MRLRRNFLKILYMCGCVSLLSGCGRPDTVSESTNLLQETDEIVFGASEMYETYSISDSGILYGKNNTIRYYDCEVDEEYILCSRVNCSHSNEECSAWYKSYGMAGIAYYKEKIWYLKENEKKNTWELISMDVTGEEQQIKASLDIGDAVGNSWILNTIHDVYYTDDKAVVCAEYVYVSDEMKDELNMNRMQYQIIELKDGTVTTVNEIVHNTEEYSLEGISKDVLIFKVRENQMKMLTEKEFYQAYADGEFTKDAFSTEYEEDLYFEYTSKWYPANCIPIEKYVSYDLKKREKTVLEELSVMMTFDDDGYQIGELPKYIFLGEYNDEFLVSEPDWNSTFSRVFLWNVKNGSKEEVLSIKDGGTLSRETGCVSQNVYDDGKFLYCEYGNDDKAIVYQYDIQTETSRELFEDKRNITFRIINDTEEEFIGKRYTDYGYSLYRINKEDYYAGKMDRKEKLKL